VITISFEATRRALEGFVAAELRVYLAAPSAGFAGVSFVHFALTFTVVHLCYLYNRCFRSLKGFDLKLANTKRISKSREASQ